MIPFIIRLHFKFTFTFTFLYQKLPVTFVTFFFLECLLKLRPDVAPTAWRRNFFCVPMLPSLHRHAFSAPSYRFLSPLATLFLLLRIAFSSPSYRFLIPLATLSHPPCVTFPSFIFVTFSASSWWIVKNIPVCATTA